MKRARLQGAAAVAQAFRSQATADVEVYKAWAAWGNVAMGQWWWFSQKKFGTLR